MIKKMKKVKVEVKKLLTTLPHLRDDDNKLVANIWFDEIGKEKIKTMSAFELLTVMSEGKLTPSKSIIRVRATIQEQNEDLRGKNYKERNKIGDETRQTIHTL